MIKSEAEAMMNVLREAYLEWVRRYNAYKNDGFAVWTRQQINRRLYSIERSIVIVGKHIE